MALALGSSLICGSTGDVQARAVPADTAPRHTKLWRVEIQMINDLIVFI